MQQYPEYAAPHYKTLSEFTVAEFAQHPSYFVRPTLPDIRDGFYVAPHLYAPDTYRPFWVAGTEAFFTYLARAYAFFLVLLAALLLAWCRPAHAEYALCVMVLLAYGEFWRLRFPIGWGVLLVGVVFLIQLVQARARALDTWR